MDDKNQKIRKTIGRVLIVAGSLLILFVITVNLIDLGKSTAAVEEFKERKVKVKVEKIDSEGNVIAPEDSEDILEESVSVETGKVMYLLRIPKIKLEEAVREGSTPNVLSSALGHVENTAFPGEDGNCCIAGHRNYVFGKYFNRLDEIEEGDYIEIETPDEIYKYKVTGIEIVEPEDISVLEYSEGKNMTLITCTPFMIGTHRLIVHAEMVEEISIL